MHWSDRSFDEDEDVRESRRGRTFSSLRHDDDGDDEPDDRFIRRPRHSGWGVASLVLALGSGLLLFGLVVVAGVLEASTPGGIDQNAPTTVILGLLMIGCFFCELLALGLGIAGLCAPQRTKVFAVLGTVFATLACLGVLVLALIGIMVG